MPFAGLSGTQALVGLDRYRPISQPITHTTCASTWNGGGQPCGMLIPSQTVLHTYMHIGSRAPAQCSIQYTDCSVVQKWRLLSWLADSIGNLQPWTVLSETETECIYTCSGEEEMLSHPNKFVLLFLLWSCLTRLNTFVASSGMATGMMEGSGEGSVMGSVEGSVMGSVMGSGEGSVEGSVMGSVEGSGEGSVEGSVEGSSVDYKERLYILTFLPNDGKTYEGPETLPIVTRHIYRV